MNLNFQNLSKSCLISNMQFHSSFKVDIPIMEMMESNHIQLKMILHLSLNIIIKAKGGIILAVNFLKSITLLEV